MEEGTEREQVSQRLWRHLLETNVSPHKTEQNKNKNPYKPCSKQFTRVSQPFRLKVRLTVLILAVMPVGGGIP